MARLEPRARGILRAYREAKASPSHSHDALWTRIEASLDDGAPGLIVEATPGPRPVWVAPVAALTVAAAAIAVIGLGLSLGRQDTSSSSPMQAPHQAAPRIPAPVKPSSSAPAAAAPVEPQAPVTDDRPPSTTKPRSRVGGRIPRGTPSIIASPPTAEPAGNEPAVADTLLLETALIQRARRALQAEAPQRALAVLDEHAREFPRGQMREDRRVLRIEALCAAEKGPQARAEARQFLRSFPGSAHASRVRGLCPAR